jgi:hypothetical protein
MAAKKPLSVSVGDLILCRYFDHLFYKDSDESSQKPRLMEAYGRLAYEDDDFIRLRFEQYSDPDASARTKDHAMGLCIVKACIQELRRA